MDAEERVFREKTTRALQSHVTELDAMETAVCQAARERTEIPISRRLSKS